MNRNRVSRDREPKPSSRPRRATRVALSVDGLEDRRLLSNVIPEDLAPLVVARPALRFDRLSTDLVDIYRASTVAKRPADLATYFADAVAPLIYDGDRVGVTVTTTDAVGLRPSLEALGFQVLASIPDLNVIEGFLPVSALADVTTLGPQGLQGVIGIVRPAAGSGSVLSQADYTLQAGRVRATAPPGLTGAGVGIGVISDSYNRLGGAAADVASGDLPNNLLNFLEGPATGVIDEGRAMAQLVFDLAPGSPLAFGSAFYGQAAFGQLIRDLANPANFGAKVITDDIFYFEEPLFQDGLIAQGIDDVVLNRDVAYFALAGNLSDQSYESTNISFVNQVVAPISASAANYYDFDPGPGVDVRQRVTLANGQFATINLQWDQPFFTAAGVTTDLDFFVIDTVTNAVVASSARNNPAIQQPSEIVGWSNTSGVARGYDIVIQNFSGPSPGRIKWVNYGSNNAGNIVVNDFPTNSPTVVPHSAALGLSVGASPFFDQRSPEGFSSIGPNTILFNANGTAKAAPEVRQTPDITATDGTSTTFFGQNVPGVGFLFFGTSAAAPHAAAVGALLRQAEPGLTGQQVQNRMTSTANDLGVAGFDNKTGFGLVNAYKAIFGATVAATVNVSDGFESGALNTNWDVFNSGSGRTQVVSTNGPAAGARHLVLDSNLPAGFATPGLSESILSVNLTGQTGVAVTFASKRFGSETITAMPASFVGHNNSDGVAFSVDGTNWFRLSALPGISTAYQTFTVDLSAAAAGAGVTLGANTRIKVQRFDVNSGQAPVTGLAFDSVAVTAAAPVTAVTAVTVDNGPAQRSRVRNFTVDFSGAVASIGAGAFRLVRSDGLVVPLTVAQGPGPGPGTTRVVLTAAGPNLQGGSIPDGNYVLTVDGGLIVDGNGELVDAAGNGVRGSVRAVALHRFFGDSNGDGLVDGTDYLAFRAAYLSGNATAPAASIFDFDGDGLFTLADLNAFNENFRKRRLS